MIIWQSNERTYARDLYLAREHVCVTYLKGQQNPTCCDGDPSRSPNYQVTFLCGCLALPVTRRSGYRRRNQVLPQVTGTSRRARPRSPVLFTRRAHIELAIQACRYVSGSYYYLYNTHAIFADGEAWPENPSLRNGLHHVR